MIGHLCYNNPWPSLLVESGAKLNWHKEVGMAEVRRDKLSIYIPQEKLKEKPIERLMKLAKERDRSVNYLVVKAILEFLEREDKK